MSRLAIITTLVLLSSSCFEGPALFQKDGGTGSQYSVISKADGGVTEGSFSASNGATQVLGVSDNSQISGASVSIQPGALAVDTRISLQEGASIATAGLASEIGVSGAVNPAGPAVVLSSSIAIDASLPIKVKLPKKSSKLAMVDGENVVVVYRAFQAALDRTVVGVIPTSELKITDDSVEAATRFFGSYQVAIAEVAIKKSIVKESTIPILTKSEEKQLPKISIQIVSGPTLDEDNREVNLNIKLSQAVALLKCTSYIHAGNQDKWIDSESTEKASELDVLSSGSTDSYTYRPTYTEEKTVNFRFACLDANGRTLTSAFTKDISIPALVDEPPAAPIEVAFLGAAAWPGTIAARTITIASRRLIEGQCDSTLGNVTIYLDYSFGLGSVSFSCTNNRFQFYVEANNTCTTSPDFCLGNQVRGVRFYANQGYTSSDETVIFIDTAGTSSIVPINTSHFIPPGIFPAHTTTSLLILTEDVVLDSSTPVGATRPSLFSKFDGDLRTIRNLRIDVGDGSANQGVFSSLQPGSSVRHLKIANAFISIPSTSTPSYRVGFVAGAANNAQIEGIEITDSIIHAADPTPGHFEIGAVVGALEYESLVNDVQYRGTYNGSSYTSYIKAAGGEKIGGLVGALADAKIMNSSVDTVYIEAKTKFGGVVGFTMGTDAIYPEYLIRLRSNVSLKTNQTTATSAYVGGIVGYADDANLSITEVSAISTIECLSATTEAIGGIAGYFKAQLLAVESSLLSTTCTQVLGGIAGSADAGTMDDIIVKMDVPTSCTNCGFITGKFYSTDSNLIISDAVLPTGSLIRPASNNIQAVGVKFGAQVVSGTRIFYDTTYSNNTDATLCAAVTPTTSCTFPNLQTTSTWQSAFDLADWVIDPSNNLLHLKNLP